MQGRGEAKQNQQEGFDLDRPIRLADQGFERVAFDEFHDIKQPIRAIDQLVNRHDGVVLRAKLGDLANRQPQLVDILRIVHELRGDLLDRDESFERRIETFVDDGLSAHAENLDDLVFPDPLAWLHRRRTCLFVTAKCHHSHLF